MNFAALIRQVSRGHPGRGMTPEEACFLFGRILDGFIPDLELGALILALRIRTESVHELLGFHRALVQRSRQMKWKGPFLPVVLPTYNGARHHVNLTPLLALMLQRLDLPVLLHGVHESYGRVTSVRILEKWGIDPAHTLEEAEKQLESRKIAYIEPELVYPGIEQLLNYRTRLGVRNSAHSLVKLMNPFDCPSLRMVAASHPDYLEKLSQVLLETRGHALLFRATQGEPYVNPMRMPQLVWIHEGKQVIQHEAETAHTRPAVALPERFGVEESTVWMKQVLNGDSPVPETLVLQVGACLVASGRVRDRMAASSLIQSNFIIQHYSDEEGKVFS